MLEQNVLSSDELKQRAHTLALENITVYHRRGTTPFHKLRKIVEQLEAYSHEFEVDESAGFPLLPAMEWLMDHVDLFKEQNLNVEKNLSPSYYRRLPKWDAKSSQTRISVILENFLQNMGGQASLPMLSQYISSFQEISTLTMGELWSIPLFLRISLIEELGDLFEEVFERHKARKQAEELFQKWVPHLADQDKLSFEIDRTTSDLSVLPTVLVVYIIGRLRDYGEEGIPIRQWIERKVGLQTEGIEKLIGHEHQLQANYRVTAGNLISSLRDVSRWQWEEQFESLSTVERILENDPGRIYLLMDFTSRDQLRHAVEHIAKTLKVQECLIAQTAVSLASKFSTMLPSEKVPQKHVGYYLVDQGKAELYAALQRNRKVSYHPLLWFKRHPTFTFLSSVMILVMLTLFIFWKVVGGFSNLNIWATVALSLVLLVPASEWSLSIVNALIQRFFPPEPLLRLEFKEGVTSEAATMVVIPTFLSSEADVRKLLHHIEVHHLANQDPHIHFAILGDFRDACEETLPQDNQILQTARQVLEDLNHKYPCQEGSTFYLLVRKRLWNPKEGVWMGWERKRGKLTEFNALLLGDQTTSFTDILGDTNIFPKIRYVITLDSDTELPRDAAKRLIGTMAHPLNIPLLNEDQTRVVRGYGLLQPRILVKHESLYRSRLAYWFAGVTGIDPYTFAISDPYQDLFGHGIFTGKGIYDLTIFDKILSHRFPDNTVLSHDLLEGGFLRAGLVTDIELMDDFPSNYYAYLQRMHRWVRGDWQLLRWFSPKVRNRRGTRLWVDLPIITRWQMLDNLRRSLLGPVLLGLTIFSILGLPGWKMGWLSIVMSTIAIPLFIHSLNSVQQRLKWRWRWQNLLGVLGQIAVTAVMLPFKSANLLDAILRTLYRLIFSKKHLLEWVTAADVERQTPKTVGVFIFRLSKGYFFVVLLLLGTLFSERDLAKLGLAIGLLWMFGPFLAYWLSKPQLDKKTEMIADERNYVRALAYDTWRFFELVVQKEDSWLPPDNLQVDPPRGIAHRTSPTNIGLLLGSTVVARDLGYLTTTELMDRLEHTLDSLETMQRWQGHFYNWYDTCTLEPLLPLYVSTVDSGNMVAYLLTVKQGVKEWGNNPLVDQATILGMLDRITKEEQDGNKVSVELSAWKQQLEDVAQEQTISYVSWYRLLLEANVEQFPLLIQQRVDLALKELKELIPSLELIGQMGKQDFAAVNGLAGQAGSVQGNLEVASAQEQVARLGPLWEEAKTLPEIVELTRVSLKVSGEMTGEFALQWRKALEKGHLSLVECLARIETLQTRLETMSIEPDFRPLYNEKIRLMAIGYNVSSQQRDNSYYDLMASEARQASFIGIALGQLPTEHWFALGRTLTRVGRDTALLSWTGTMFEYLMPLLLMNCYRDTLWDETYKSIVKKHISYATNLGLPWGISESGFYAFDFQMNYQYQAFGVPFLGLKRGLGFERVIAPYATVLASLIDFKAAFENLKVLEKLGARGEYGFYEALDFTKERLPETEQNVAIKSFMAHHQGMSLVALSHLLVDRPLGSRFHADPRIQAIKLLLQERISQKPVVLKRWKWAASRPPRAKDESEFERRFYSADTPMPEARILSNGRYVVMLTSSGSGFSRFGELAVSRWRENPARDPWGSFFYINDLTQQKIWSATYQPCHDRSASGEMSFSLEKVTYTRTNGDIHTLTEVSVSPEWDAEIRRITFTNQGKEAHFLEVTSYSEVVLAPQAADDAHPAFNKLFVHTEFSDQPEALMAHRRGRTPEEYFPWLAHSVSVEGKTVGVLEYETDRARFLGRGQSYDCPKAVVENQRLSGTLGSVLDPILALRRRVEVPTGEKVRLTFVTGVAETREKVLTMIQHLSSPHQVEHTLELAWTRSRIELRYLNLSTRQADIYQWMLSQIFYFNPLRTMRAESMMQNRKGQSALWNYGISGDIPLVLIHVSELENLDLVSSVLLAHEYWRLRGLKVDLLILNDFAGSYEQPLTEALRHLVFASSDRDFLDRPGGVFIRSSNIMPVEDKILFATVARISLKADGGNLAKQLTAPKVERNLPAVLIPKASSWTPERISTTNYAKDMAFFNGLGGFVAGGHEYAIYLNDNKLTPVPWSNILANPSFGTQISESGAGYTWAENSRENKLTPWNNDPVMDLPGEVCYLRDEGSGEFWSLTCFPIHEEDPYTVYHGWGYSRFEHTSHGISQEGLVFVPLSDSLKVWQVTLRNLDRQTRQISLTYYVEWVLGVQREVNAPFIITEIDEGSGALLARNTYQEVFPDRKVFLWVQTVGEKPNRTWTGDRMEFLGRHGSLKKPAALSRAALSNSSGMMYNSCGAIQVTLTLEPGEEKQVLVLLGQARSCDEVTSLTSRYVEPLTVAKQLQEVQDFWAQLVKGVQVVTPDKSMDLMLNGWLLYQTLSCRIWARSAFYQAGGAYGFRDQLQDSLALLHVFPELTKEQILRHAAHQFQEGDVQHWWHEETKRGIRTKFSDDLLWLPYSVLRYLEHTQDEELLVQEVYFLEDLPLGPDEDERYSETKISTEQASLFEHCLRAVERSLHFGAHGLPLMGTGDWNDGMNRVGREGKGESVWLGWFLYTILEGFAELCERREVGDIASRYRQVAQELARNLNEKAWDGQWYRRAYFDNGQPLGSSENQECRIDAIAQAWSVISGAGTYEKAKLAMLAVDRELVNREYSLVCLLTPPFEKTDPSPGYIQGYPPGVRENGGQYTHGVIWSIIAWAKLGEGDKAWELFQMINPINHALTPSEVLRYKVEPYVIAADVYSAEPNMGRGGWTWYTGAAGWMYQAGVEWILGLQRRGERLYLKPCIPKTWGEYSMTYRYKQTTYQIQVQNPLHKCTGGSMLVHDGQDLEFSEPYISLSDDGLEHVVRLVL